VFVFFEEYAEMRLVFVIFCWEEEKSVGEWLWVELFEAMGVGIVAETGFWFWGWRWAYGDVFGLEEC